GGLVVGDGVSVRLRSYLPGELADVVRVRKVGDAEGERPGARRRAGRRAERLWRRRGRLLARRRRSLGRRGRPARERRQLLVAGTKPRCLSRRRRQAAIRQRDGVAGGGPVPPGEGARRPGGGG